MKTRALYDEALATIERLLKIHPDLKEHFGECHGYAVFPSVGRASVAVGVTFGRGIVFERGRPIGTATITELTLGVQVGGQSFSELLFFPGKDTLENLKRGEIAFTANASAVLVKAAASGTTDFRGVIAKAYSQGGMLLELSIGGQKLSFSPAPDLETRAEAPRSAERVDTNAAGQPELARDQAKQEDALRESPAARPNGHEEAPRGHHDEAREAKQPADAGHSNPGPRTGLGRRTRALVRRLERALPPPLRIRLASAAGRLGAGRLGGLLAPVRRKLDRAIEPIRREQAVSATVHPATRAALAHLLERDETLRARLERAAGCAIFPSVGKATAVLGATYGRGEVYERGRLIGYAGLVQVTIGVQLGGDTFIEVVIFDKPDALERFKQNRVAFAANASAVIVKAGVAATRSSPPGADVRVVTEGGLLLETALGGQKFVFRPAVLTRGKPLELGLPS